MNSKLIQRKAVQGSYFEKGGYKMNFGAAVELKNVTKFYSDKTKIFDDLTVSFPQKQIIGLVGENGSGKTTFIKLISGMTKQNSGEVCILGEKILDEKTTVSLRNHISILGDANRALYWNLTGMDNVEYFWVLKTGKSSSKIPDHIIEYVQSLNMATFINNKVETYSKGMKQRLLLLISLLNDPQILLMDEPLNGLDYENAVILKRMINVYTHNLNGTVFITSHDQNFLNEVCDVQYEIQNKAIVKRDIRDVIVKKIVYFIKTKTPESHQFLAKRFLTELTTVNEKTIKLCIDINDAEFYHEISKLIFNEEIVILEANGL